MGQTGQAQATTVDQAASDRSPDEPRVVTAPIVRVEVFRNTALVHRRAALPDNARVVEIRDLPLSCVDGSLRVSISAPDVDARGGGDPEVVDLHIGLQVDPTGAATPVPEVEQLKRLRREIRGLERRRSRLTAEI